jgi:hypothetical protein
MAKKADKQKVVDEIAAILGIRRDTLGNGSKEHLPFLQDIASAVGLPPTGTKHAVAKKIVEHFGGAWTPKCYSTGGSVQTHAFLIMLAALRDRLGAARCTFLVALAEARAALQMGDPPPPGNARPDRLPGSAGDFARCPRVVAWILMQAKGRCEQCDEPAPFSRADGTAYLEVHHVRPLADGGQDTVDNAVALCPTCHRASHHASDRRDRRRRLVDRLQLRGYGAPGGGSSAGAAGSREDRGNRGRPA